MILFYLPVELLLYIGSYFGRHDLISFATTCKILRHVFMVQILGGTVQIQSPLPYVTGVPQLFHFLQQRTPGLQRCLDQVAFYRRRSDLAESVHTVQVINWTAPSPRCFRLAISKLANNNPKYQAILKAFNDNQYYSNALTEVNSIYDSIVVNLVQFPRCSELRLVRTHITRTMLFTLNMMSTVRRLTLEDCTMELLNFHTDVGQGGQYESFKLTSGVVANYLSWNSLDTTRTSIQFCFLGGFSTLTKLEICIQFFHDNALDHLSLPSLTYLAIVPHGGRWCVMCQWSWRTVYLILKSSPNITCFRFEPIPPSLKIPYPFATDSWKQYKRRLGSLPLSQLSSITAYRQLVKRLVPGKPVSFVNILLFPDKKSRKFNWPDPESDDEVMFHFPPTYIVPYQLVRSTMPIKTLYMQRIDEQEELINGIQVTDVKFLHEVCPYVTDLWLPSLRIASRSGYNADLVNMEEVLDVLTIWKDMERCAIGSCSPWTAKELDWYREGTILSERVHPTLKELLLGVGMLWKWHNDTEVTGWVLYISTDIEGSEDSEEAVYPNVEILT